MNESRLVSRATVDALHWTSLEEHGGQDGLRNEHGLESALAQPQHNGVNSSPVTNNELSDAMIGIAENCINKA
jgi:death-on-curing protein